MKCYSHTSKAGTGKCPLSILTSKVWSLECRFGGISKSAGDEDWMIGEEIRQWPFAALDKFIFEETALVTPGEWSENGVKGWRLHDGICFQVWGAWRKIRKSQQEQVDEAAIESVACVQGPCMVHYNKSVPLPNPLCQEALPNSTEMWRCNETVYNIGKGVCKDIIWRD